MKKSQNFLLILAGIIPVVVVLVYAQPKIPKENIPHNIPLEVRKQIEELYSSDPVRRGWGAYYLGTFGAKADCATPFLIHILGDNVPLMWGSSVHQTSPAQEAEKALIKIGKPAVVTLIAALQDENWYVRWRSASALGGIKDVRAVEPLIDLLKDENWNVQEVAANALGEIGDVRAVEPLIARLRSENYVIRRDAASALGKIKDSRAVEPLIVLLKDEAPPVRDEAAGALRNITGKDFSENYEKWLKWWNQNKAK